MNTVRVRPRPRPIDAPWRVLAYALTVAVGTVLTMVVVALLIVPRLTGGQSLTVLTGSMEPALRPGDVVVVRGIAIDEVCGGIGVGDIVTYLPEPDDPSLITHRVVGKTIGTFDDGTACRLITQGDANSAADPPVSPEQVRGVFLYGVPQVGWARQWAAQNATLLLIAAGVAVVAWLLWDQLRPRRTRVVTVPGGATAALASDDALRLRELALREREVAVRERELDLAAAQASGRAAVGAASAERAARDRAEDTGEDGRT
ncbi:signal peptidase I [Microbacterium sp. NPDC096154]|uniref:signal peptidase I n=1 Tax=Microbacterium sp. NPDC096154 TaxID=3155549 RepID=UPI00332666EF